MVDKGDFKASRLRQRRDPIALDKVEEPSDSAESTKTVKEEIVWGQTPGGTVFRVPTTHDVLTSLFHPKHPKSHFDILNLVLLGSQLVLYVILPNHVAKIFFLIYFTFWRAAYDLGLGLVLNKQSKKRWMVREVLRRGWMDESTRPAMRNWIKKQLVGKMGKDYSFDELPVEYNTWLLFRQLVDVILLNDFLSYCMFAFACFRVPTGVSIAGHIMRWIGGIGLIAFNLWVKTEAHRIVKDYGWYWGDAFFQRGALVFDGVFEMAPHPMYSVGYAGYYGLSLIVGSYPVLFVSLFAHAAQFGFLAYFENPHIERMYGQRKPLALRIPLFIADGEGSSSQHKHHRSVSETSTPGMSTPSATEGDTATETEVETEVEENLPSRETKIQSHLNKTTPNRRSRLVSQHDLLNRYFRKDVIGIHNIDLLRASDCKYLFVIIYALGYSLLPSSISHQTNIVLHSVHAIIWRLIHSLGLGILLRLQSEKKFMVRHYLKNYFYPEDGTAAITEAFENWKQMYTLSLSMTYVSFVGLAYRTYQIPENWVVGDELLRHTFGAILIGIHYWAAKESYQVLGMFGWFFGDFFIEDYPATLVYTGIYRFLKNPERTMSGAAFFGLALISGSKLVFTLAVVSHLAHWGFLNYVENPHMQKLYGPDLREDAGLTKTIKKVTRKQAKILKRKAPELERVVQEVRGTFDKVYADTAHVVEEFLAKSKPRIEGVVQDSKVLLQQTRERLVITRVTNDFSRLNTKLYNISLVIPAQNHSSGSIPRFHIGEKIRVRWRAPKQHSRKDWIGLYRFGSNRSNIVTKTSSLGRWVPVHDEEWDGDFPLNHVSTIVQNGDERSRQIQSGTVEEGESVFEKEQLPWSPGIYEVRYHHDEKYNVMSLDGPFEVYVPKPQGMDFISIKDWLMRIVVLCLDSDPALIPAATMPFNEIANVDDHANEDGERQPDDFRFWSEKQAARIAICIKHAFGVEYAPEVVVADANVGSLARKILVSRELLAETH